MASPWEAPMQSLALAVEIDDIVAVAKLFGPIRGALALICTSLVNST